MSNIKNTKLRKSVPQFFKIKLNGVVNYRNQASYKSFTIRFSQNMSVILERGDHCSAVLQTSHERLSFTGIPETERPPECYLITVAMQNSDLETFSHNFASLQPRTYLKCLNLWFLLYWAGLLLQQHIVIEVKLTCVMTNPSSCSLLVGEQSNACWILLHNDGKSWHWRVKKRPKNAFPPQACDPCGNFSDTSCLKPQESEGSLGPLWWIYNMLTHPSTFSVCYLTLWWMHLRATWDWDTQGYK